MTILDQLTDQNVWLGFYQYKCDSGHLSHQDSEELKTFIEQESYLPIVTSILRGKAFPFPRKKLLNKMHSQKKRTVYLFDRPESFVLKLISWLLHDYDCIFADNLYSFRRDCSARQAIQHLTRTPGIENMWSYKMDIHDYFNSVNIKLLLPMLSEIFADDEPFYHFLRQLLENENVISGDQVIQEKKGIMAGIPVSAFLANVYLMKVDAYFQENQILYARYSDDILIFADSREELQTHIAYMENALCGLHLTFNPDKVEITAPGERWNFLGIAFQDGVIDLSPVTMMKLKGKMKRKARALYRWKMRKQASDAQTIRAYLRHFNKKFFANPIHNELTWCRWFFPLINTDQSLKELDHYMQSCMRYLVSGRYTKSNYNLRYEDMKEYGYRSLVHAYYEREIYL